MLLNIKSNSKAWITNIAHHNVPLRSIKDLLLETKKLLISHCFVDIDVQCGTPIMTSLSWNFFSIPNNSIVLKIWEPWLAIKFKSSIEFVVHPAFFHPSYLLLSHLHYKFWNKIMALSRVIRIMTREFYTRTFGFEVLGDNIKVFYGQGWHYQGQGVPWFLHNFITKTWKLIKRAPVVEVSLYLEGTKEFSKCLWTFLICLWLVQKASNPFMIDIALSLDFFNYLIIFWFFATKIQT